MLVDDMPNNGRDYTQPKGTRELNRGFLMISEIMEHSSHYIHT